MKQLYNIYFIQPLGQKKLVFSSIYLTCGYWYLITWSRLVLLLTKIWSSGAFNQTWWNFPCWLHCRNSSSCQLKTWHSYNTNNFYKAWVQNKSLRQNKPRYLISFLYSPLHAQISQWRLEKKGERNASTRVNRNSYLISLNNRMDSFINLKEFFIKENSPKFS